MLCSHVNSPTHCSVAGSVLGGAWHSPVSDHVGSAPISAMAQVGVGFKPTKKVPLPGITTRQDQGADISGSSLGDLEITAN